MKGYKKCNYYINCLKIKAKREQRKADVWDKHYSTIKNMRRMARKPTQLSYVQIIGATTIATQSPPSSQKSVATKSVSQPAFDRIVCSFRTDGQLFHLIKLKGIDKCLALTNHEVNTRWPQEIIGYYEKRLCFGTL